MDDARVLIVAESPLARAGLAALLNGQPGLIVVGQAAPDPELMAAVEAFEPEVIAWDLGWEAQAALEQMVDIKDALPPVLALLADDARAADALNAGVRGLLLQNADADTLSAALRAVALGLVVVAPGLAPTAVAPGGPPLASPAETLTPRELEVLALVAEGLPNKTIASRLAISEHTVKFHVNAVMTKLGAQSRTEAVVIAARLGFIAL